MICQRSGFPRFLKMIQLRNQTTEGKIHLWPPPLQIELHRENRKFYCSSLLKRFSLPNPILWVCVSLRILPCEVVKASLSFWLLRVFLLIIEFLPMSQRGHIPGVHCSEMRVSPWLPVTTISVKRQSGTFIAHPLKCFPMYPYLEIVAGDRVCMICQIFIFLILYIVVPTYITHRHLNINTSLGYRTLGAPPAGGGGLIRISITPPPPEKLPPPPKLSEGPVPMIGVYKHAYIIQKKTLCTSYYK